MPVYPKDMVEVAGIRRHRGGIVTAIGRLGQQETVFTYQQNTDDNGGTIRAVIPRIGKRGELTGFDVKQMK